MARKVRITLAQFMAILALVGILLSVVGTAWMTNLPVSDTPLVSGESVPVSSY